MNFLALIFLTSLSAHAATESAVSTPTDTVQLCAKATKGKARLEAVAKSLAQDEIFNFVSGRSKATSCRGDGDFLKIEFKNGDKVNFNSTEIAPRIDAELAKPIDENLAFLVAIKTMLKTERCDLNIRNPSKVEADGGGLKTKTYWCGENVALSLTSNAKGKARSFSTWFIH